MTNIEGVPPKYLPLYHFLDRKRAEGQKYFQMTFEDVETIVESVLPSSARTQPLFWDNLRQPKRASTSWYRAGWKTADVDMQSKTLTFYIAQ